MRYMTHINLRTAALVMAVWVVLASAQTDAIVVSPVSLDLGVVEIGQASTAQFTVENTAGSTVTVEDITSDNPRYSAGPTSFAIDPGLVQVVTITFSPDTVGWHPGALTLTHDGVGAPTTLGLTGFGAFLQPSLPPSGDLLDTRVAYISERDGNQEIYAINYDGTGETNLTQDSANDRAASWSPEGSQIAFESDKDGVWQIWVMDADGGGRRLLVDTPGAEGAAWSPYGGLIAFSDGSDIYVVRADGTGLITLIGGPATDRGIAWSRDGTRIAWVSDDDIWVGNADGSDAALLVDTGIQDSGPEWSPDGQWIAFSTITSSARDIYRVQADGAGLTNLTSSDDALCWHGSWSPDGTRIAYSRWPFSGDTGAIDVYTMNATDGSDAIPLVGGATKDEGPAWSPFLLVEPAPNISVAPPDLDLGSVAVGSSATASFTITSSGELALSVSDITSDNAVFTVAPDAQPLPFDLAPGSDETVTVTFTPTVEGAQTANITITHNAGSGSTVITAIGTGTVSPTAVAITAPTDGQALPPGTTATGLAVDIAGHSAGTWAWMLDTPFPATGVVPQDANDVAAGALAAIGGLVDGASHTVHVALVDGDLVDAGAVPASRDSASFTVGILPPDYVRVVSQQGAPATTITVPVLIYDVTADVQNDRVTAVDLDLLYDESVLTPTSDGGGLAAASPGVIVPADWSLQQNIASPGRLSVSLAGDAAPAEPALDAEGVLLEISFDVSASAVAGTSTPIELGALQLNEGSPSATGVDGLFTVLSIMYGDATGNGAIAAFDASWVLRYVSSGLVGEPDLLPIETSAPVWAPLPLTRDEAVQVADVDTVDGVTSMDATDILRKRVGIIDLFVAEGGAPSAPSAAPGVVAYDLRGLALSERPGARVTVILDASAMADLHAGELVLDFDPSLLRPVDAALRRLDARVAARRPLLTQSEGDGRIALAFASARPIEASDALIEVAFEATRDIPHARESAIRASHLRLNRSLIETDFAFPFRIEPYRNRLMANYPNPFNPETWIPFELAESADVTIRVYGVDGGLVRTLELGARSVGEYTTRGDAAYWDGRNAAGEAVASGVYIYELIAGDYHTLRRMVVMK
ncbi:hypothetical protein CMK11_09400 [Candidatus Poribacteria bacterium]|nr:hypothetical protein [Candidatus Poribacteria bacterium]